MKRCRVCDRDCCSTAYCYDCFHKAMYTEERTLAERICRILGMVATDDTLADEEEQMTAREWKCLVYTTCHLTGECTEHPDWLKEFETLESEIEEAHRAPGKSN